MATKYRNTKNSKHQIIQKKSSTAIDPQLNTPKKLSTDKNKVKQDKDNIK